jgi:hypothetical protein
LIVDSKLQRQLKQAGIDPAKLLPGTRIDGVPIEEAIAEESKPLDRYKSKTERYYSWELDEQQKAGAILRWEYEALKFRLADGALFTPDFCVWMPGQLQLREIKGGFIREAARVRFLVAKRLYPEFTWRMIQRQKSGWVDVL